MILKLNDYLRRGRMKINWIKKGLSVVLAGAMVICLAASAFSGGQMALAGIGGLILGILGSTLVLNRKRRKDEPEAA